MAGADIAPSLSSRWRGDYGGKKQLWFPSNYVEEITSPTGLEPEREVSMAMSAARRACAPALPTVPSTILLCFPPSSSWMRTVPWETCSEVSWMCPPARSVSAREGHCKGP